MALYKQGSRREEDHKAERPKRGCAAAAMMDRAESPTVRDRAAAGLAAAFGTGRKRVFMVTIKRVGGSSDHIALGTEKVIYVTAFCKPA